MKRQAARELYERTELAFISTIDRRRAQFKARAIEVAGELMERGQSEQVRMRAVEFFAGEARNSQQINVAVNVDRGGYEFVKPGQRIVDITPAPDSLSGDDDTQAIDHADD